VCATQPRGHIRRTATLSYNEPLRPTAQLTTTLVYPQVPPSPNSVHTMDHLLDLEWTVVDVALAGVESPDTSPAAQPSVPRPATPTGQPPSGTPQPGSPHEKPQETTASSRNTADDTAPARTPAPAQIAKDLPEDICDGEEYEEWVEDNPYGRGPQATRLPRPESLCWRCGVPGHSRGDCRAPVVLFCSRCGTMGLMSRDCPCPRPPAARKPPPPPAGTPRNVRRFRSERRARSAATVGDNAAVTAGQTATQDFPLPAPH
jgi:hypothetical protein